MMKNVKDDDAILSVQLSKLREVAELWWDCIAKLIRGKKAMKRVTKIHEQAQNSKVEIA